MRGIRSVHTGNTALFTSLQTTNVPARLLEVTFIVIIVYQICPRDKIKNMEVSFIFVSLQHLI